MSVAIHTSSRAAAHSVADFHPQRRHGYCMICFLPSKTTVNGLTGGRAKNFWAAQITHFMFHHFLFNLRSEELLIARHLSIYNLDPGSTPDSTTNKYSFYQEPYKTQGKTNHSSLKTRALQQHETHDLTVSPLSKWREGKDRFSLQDQLCNGQQKTGDRFSAPRADLILYNGHSLSDAVYKHQKILVSTITVFDFVSWSGLFVNLTEDTSELILLQAFRCWQ
ncbi:hypothetical protein C8R44DRAFT_927192 [Mycena epipterygia]|nr:hypothetical protein C8R44DRAFT_927192 [Mycena epipterygia]